MLTATPWGAPQHQKEIAPGIVQVSTASHGGIYLAEDRWAAFRALFPAFHPWAGDQWLEEDVDANLAALVFPEHFTDETVAVAVGVVANYEGFTGENYMGEPKAWIASNAPAAVALRARAAAFNTSMAMNWRVGSMSTSGKGWQVWLSRGDVEKIVVLKDYPPNSYLSDAEVAALTMEGSVQ